ncbi:MAG: hypothetical protein ACYTFV_09790 [Planctomycetota bacterium]|jgi:hypothetical protein
MQNRIALVVLALAGTLTYFANSTMSVPGTDESSTRAATSLVDEDVADRGAQEQQLRRAFEIAVLEPTLERHEVETLVAQSDRVREDLEGSTAEDAGETSVGDHVRRLLEEAKSTDTEALALYQAERELFGGRSFEQSRATIDRLLAIRAVQAELGL